MPVVDSRQQKTNPEYYANYSYNADGALTVTAKSLMTPFSQYDAEWWNSFLSKEDGFLRYFETCDWAEPFQLKKCWDTMELWESLATHETTPEPFVRPFWATISYHQAFLKIYQGQEVTMYVNDAAGARSTPGIGSITSPWERVLAPEIVQENNMENYRCFNHATGLTDGKVQEEIKNQLFENNSYPLVRVPGFWEENDYDQIIEGDINTMMVSINSWLGERDRYNQGMEISVDNGSLSASIQDEQPGLIANFDNISNYLLTNPRRGDRRTRQILPNLWNSILTFGWSAGRDIPVAVSSAQDEWLESLKDNTDSQLVSKTMSSNGELKPYEVDVFALQDWNFPVNRVFAGAKSGYRFIINWTRILSYRLTNLLSD